MILVLLIIALAGLYGIAVIYAANRFSDSDIPALEIQQERESFSIIIPFRNEAENLPKLLQSFEQIQYDYDNYEIIFCNDHSTDSSCDIVQHWLAIFQGNASLIHSESPGKKAALSAGINTAKHKWTLTTDADCTISSQWLHAFNFDLIKNDWLCLTGLVSYQNNRTFIQYYQSYENAALVALSGLAITQGKTLSANGANFCFHGKLFSIWVDTVNTNISPPVMTNLPYTHLHSSIHIRLDLCSIKKAWYTPIHKLHLPHSYPNGFAGQARVAGCATATLYGCSLLQFCFCSH